MNAHRYIPLALVIMLALSCNFPLFSSTGQKPVPPGNPPTDTPAPGLPLPATDTSVPTLPTATLVPTPTVPQVTPISVAVNCRYGPDVGYAAISAISVGQVATIAGKNSDGSWWYVQDPNSPGSYCWVSASVVTAAGNLSGIGIVAPPSAVVTKVTVGASVTFSMCGGPNVVEFSGSISTNGPTKVDFQWEITGDKNNTTSPQSITFKAAGTKSAPDPGAYTADCGHYTITLHVLNPNDTSASKNFKIGP